MPYDHTHYLLTGAAIEKRSFSIPHEIVESWPTFSQHSGIEPSGTPGGLQTGLPLPVDTRLTGMLAGQGPATLYTHVCKDVSEVLIVGEVMTATASLASRKARHAIGEAVMPARPGWSQQPACQR